MNIFEQASRTKVRFTSAVGELTTEQLWDLPLTSKTGKTNLDSVARTIHAELKDMDEVSFVEEKPNPRKTHLQLAMDIVKHVIETKIADNKAALDAADKAERKRKILAALDAKNEQALTSMSQEELQAELAKL